MSDVNKQLRLPLREHHAWGGIRAGSGRKPTPGLGRVPHVKRRPGRLDVPIQVTLRLRSGLPSLRTPWGKAIVHRAALRMRAKGATLSHYAILSNRSEERRVGKECRSRWS